MFVHTESVLTAGITKREREREREREKERERKREREKERKREREKERKRDCCPLQEKCKDPAKGRCERC